MRKNYAGISLGLYGLIFSDTAMLVVVRVVFQLTLKMNTLEDVESVLNPHIEDLCCHGCYA